MLSTLLLVTAALAAPDHCEDSPQVMALTFDDLPLTRARYGNEAIAGTNRAILDALDERSAPAIGFVNEGKLHDEADQIIRARVAALEMWIDAGHLLGNHGFNHQDLHRVDVETWCADVARGDAIVRPLMVDAGHSGPLYFRHPYLHTGMDEAVRSASRACLAAEALVVAPVSIDNGEWLYAAAFDRLTEAKRPTSLLVSEYLEYMGRVVDYYEDQSCKLMGRLIPQVLLLHANRLNGAALADLLAALEDRGYRFVTLEEALADPAYQRDDQYFGSGGISWVHRWALTDGKRGAFFAGEPEVPESVQAAAEGDFSDW